MSKFFRRILLAVAVALWAVASIAGIALAAARALLPETCAVSEAQVATLELEKNTYADVVARLGCDGVLKQRQDYGGQILIEDYSWRGDAWPYARFDAHFINHQLHGTETYWLKLDLTT